MASVRIPVAGAFMTFLELLCTAVSGTRENRWTGDGFTRATIAEGDATRSEVIFRSIGSHRVYPPPRHQARLLKQTHRIKRKEGRKEKPRAITGSNTRPSSEFASPGEPFPLGFQVFSSSSSSSSTEPSLLGKPSSSSSNSE